MNRPVTGGVALRLEAPQITGRNAVAALVRQDISVTGDQTALWGHAALEPVAFLCLIDGAEQAFDANGRPLDAAEVEQLLPGAWESFRSEVAMARWF